MHHPVSQSRVYQDTKNTVKRCMDPNASLSHVFPDYGKCIYRDHGPVLHNLNTGACTCMYSAVDQWHVTGCVIHYYFIVHIKYMLIYKSSF